MRAIAQRYASALLDVAVEEEYGEEAGKELGQFVRLFQESTDLRNFLACPSIPRGSKHELIEKLVRRLGGSGALRNFLFVVANNGRIPLLPQILEEFLRQLYERMGIVEADVYSVQELSEQQTAHLRTVLEHLTGKKIKPRFRLDPTLVGGAVVQIGSTSYDGSLRGQLEQMRKRMAGD